MTIVLVALAAIVAAVFFVPIGVEVSASKGAEDAAPCVRMRLKWLTFSWLIRGRGEPRPRTRHPAAPKPKARRRSFNARAAFTSPGFVRRCLRLVRDLGRRALPDRIRASGRVGFDDPADTGILLGWLYAVAGMPESANGSFVRIVPEFGGATVEGQAELRWSRSVASLLWPLVTFVASPAVWRALRVGLTGATGSTGSAGSTGSTGATGATGSSDLQNLQHPQNL